MSAADPSEGLSLLRQRIAAIPDALRLAAASPLPDLRARAGGGFVVTGIGSSAAHARYLVQLLTVQLGLRARFAAPGEFALAPPPRASAETLVVFSQGLSPNARFALARSGAFAHVVLVTSTPEDGGGRADGGEKRTLLASLASAGAAIVRLPGADEYGTLLRVLGPMLGYLGALRIAGAQAPGALTFDVDAICAAISSAPERLAGSPPHPEESVAFLALGPASELADDLRFKLLEGLRRPAPPVWDLLHFAHGPWQELHDRRALLLALTHSGVAEEHTILAEVEALLVPGRHRLLRLEARLAPPLAIFEHEALLNALVLRGIEAEGIDPARWPGHAEESGLYRLQPAAPAAGPAHPGPLPPEHRPFGALTWQEVESLVGAGRRTVVIPLGALEQHGPHLPLDTDTRIADALAERFCTLVPEAVRLPALAVGCSREHLAFPGTLDLRATTLEAVLVDVIDSLVRHGFEHLFVFSAHGGNDAALRAMLPALRAAAAPARLLAFTGLTRLAESQARASAAEGIEAGACGHHAGEHETSILLGLAPNAVRSERMEPGRGESSGDAQSLFYPSLRPSSPNGIVGDPRTASGARAERYLAAWVALLVDAYREEKKAK